MILSPGFLLQQYDISLQQQRSEPADTWSAELAGTGHQLDFFLFFFVKKSMTLVRETFLSSVLHNFLVSVSDP